jgi:gliding motility-associated-like protein
MRVEKKIFLLGIFFIFFTQIHSYAQTITGWRNSGYKYCFNESPDTLTISSPSIYLDGVLITAATTGVTLLNNTTILLTPSQLSYSTAGTNHSLRFKAGLGWGSAYTFTVYSVTLSYTGLANTYCIDDGIATLNGTHSEYYGDSYITNGRYTGTGVTNNGTDSDIGYFNPANAGVGTHDVSYIYTDHIYYAAGTYLVCGDTLIKSVTVDSNIAIKNLASAYCVNNASVIIKGSPIGGSFTISPNRGLTDNGNGTYTFSPSVAGAGTYTVTYSATNACGTNTSQTVTVNALPSPSISNLAAEYCANATPVTITGNYAPSGTFTGAGLSNITNGTATFTPGSLAAGSSYNVTYSYTNASTGCSASVTRPVLIKVVPTASITGNATICKGTGATLTFSFSGVSPYDLTYNDGSGTYTVPDLPGPSYTTQVFPTANTTYRITDVTSDNACTTSGSGSALVQILQETAITAQPASQTVCVGRDVQFSVNAVGSNLHYQWKKDGTNISGATNTILTLNNVQITDLGLYACTVTGDCGPALQSNDAQLSFYSPTALTSSPSKVHKCEGENASLSVNASGSNLVFQWYKDNQALQDTANYLNTGSNVLTINSLDPKNTGDYYALVTGSCGTVVSLHATVTVDRTIVITTQPTNVTICAGNNATFTVIASGDNLSYQWQKDNMDIAGATNPTLAVSNVSITDEGYYTCHITSTCGDEQYSNSATLTVRILPVVTSNPVSIIRCEGDDAYFSIAATGSGISCQWRKDGNNLVNSAHIAGANTESLIVRQVTSADEGVYSCVVSGLCSNVNSTGATLTVDTTLIINSQPAEVHACENGNVFFNVNVTGNHKSYQWYKDGSQIAGATAPTLVINGVGSTDVGAYSCVISNTCNRSITSDEARLYLDNNVQITIQPVDVRACMGNNALFAIQATGAGITYQWEKDGLDISDGGNVSGTLSSTLILQNVNASNQGVYNCLVTGICGPERSVPASLTADERLNITLQPAGDTACMGSDVQFRTAATGAVHYQWQKDLTDLPGENNAILLLNNVTPSDSGVYRCLIIGSCDTLATDGALLTVKLHPSITSQPISVTVCERHQAQLSVAGNGSDVSWTWFKNGVALTDNSRIHGTQTEVLDIDSVVITDGGVYSAAISDYCGNTHSNDAALTVQPNAVITLQPQNIVVCENQSAGFSTSATGATAYQWQKNNTDIPGQNTSTLTITSATIADQGVYRCLIFGTCDTLATNGALLTVNRTIAIVQQPTDLSICEGDAAHLSLTASGAGMTYQWRYNSSNLQDNDTLSGSTTASLTIDPVKNNRSGVYHCIISNTCGTVTSDPAVISVSDSVVIIVQPQSKTLCTGQTANFSVQATGSGLTRQWQKNGINIPGATGSFYTISSVSESDTGLYHCLINGTCGQVISEGALLRINVPPSLTTQPAPSLTLCAGKPLMLSVTAQGSDVQYQWLFNGSALSDNSIITGANTAHLFVNQASDITEGLYICRISNTCSSAFSNGTQVWVNDPAIITEQPRNTSICAGESTSLSINATGYNVTYQWQKNNINIGGATSPVYPLNNATVNDSGRYRCMVYSTCDTVTSTNARVTVTAPLVISQQPSVLLTPCEGTTASLNVTATGNVLAYQWKKNGIALINDIRISGAQAANLQILNLVAGDEGNYTCELTGTCNTISTTISRIDIQAAPVIVFQPADYSVLAGGNASFNVTASGDSLRYQWYFNNAALSNGAGISGANASALTLSNVTNASQGAYNVRVSGYCGSLTSSPASLSLLASGVINSQPSGAVKCEGESTTMSITTLGSGHTYQWKKSGINLTDNNRIAGSQQATLTISNLVAADAGSYSCQVDGVENSIPANLFVNRTTVITASSGEADLCMNEAITLLVTAAGDSLRYNWYKDASLVTNNGVTTGANTAILGISPADTSHSGTYYAVVNGACGTATGDPQVILVSKPTAITDQPVSETVCEGSKTNIHLTASGTGLTYQWKHNGNILTDNSTISGSTTSSLIIDPISSALSGVYHCVVSGSCGNATSNPAVITVLDSVKITTQPQTKTVCAGQSVSFNVQASGTGLTWQWQKDGISIPGATASNMVIASVAITDTGVYRCVLDGSCGQVISEGAQLEVHVPPSVLTQPASTLTLCDGDPLSLATTSMGSDLQYQWLLNGSALSDNSNISGSNASQLVLDQAGKSNQGLYVCRISNTCSSVYTSGSQIRVNDRIYIVQQPENVNVCQGDGLSLSVYATGTNLTYQWQKGNINIAGATSQVYQISNTTLADSGTYRCVVNSACGSVVSSAARIAVSEPLVITIQPQTFLTPCEGSTITLSVTASGEILSYQWKRNGANLVTGGRISGTQTPNLPIVNMFAGDEGNYTCEITGTCNTVITTISRIDVQTAPVIVFQPADYNVLAGGNASFSVNASGDSLTYQWYYNNIALSNGSGITGADSATLLLTNVSVARQGAYHVVVSGYCGSVTSNPASLNILASSVIASQPTGDVKCEGESVSLSITTTGAGHTYQWKKNGVNIVNDSRISGAQQATLNISNLTASDAGSYNCIVDGVENSIPAQLCVNRTTVVTASSGEANICVNQAITLLVSATGDSLKYNWYKNGFLVIDDGTITGSATDIMGISPANAGHSGTYYAVVTGACGTATGNPQAILVSTPVNISDQPASANLCEGSDHSLSVTVTGSNPVYQWAYNSNNLSDNDTIGGSQAASLIINPASTKRSGIYHCVVSNLCGSETSDPAVIQVYDSVKISVQPQSKAVCLGQNVSFDVQASGSGLTFQWQKNGNDIPGAVGPFYTIAAASVSDTGVYRCVLNGSCGQVLSMGALLTVNIPPAVAAQPAPALTLCAGNPIMLTTSAGGTDLQYQWTFNGTVLSDNSMVSGATASQLIVDPATNAAEGLYVCRISNTCASVFTNGTQVWVNNPAVITQQPGNTSACAGQDISLSIVASGNDVTYQWQKGNVNIAGANSAVYQISNTALNDSGTYRCVVYSTCDTVISAAARVTISNPLVITQQPAVLLTPCEGNNVSLDVTASGDVISYQWKKNGTTLINNSRISGAQAANLQINNVVTGDEGNYTCEITGTCNTMVTSISRIDVQTAPVILFQPADYTGMAGGSASFHVTASGDSLKYQWNFNNIALSNRTGISGAQMASLSLTGLTNTQQGAYNVVITGYCGSVTSNPATLSLLTSGVITGQPADAVRCEGESTTMSITTLGTGHTYQWKKSGINLVNGSRVAGAQQATLTINNLVTSDAGSYNCLVDGVENSIPARLFVNRTTSITSTSGEASVCDNQAVTLLVLATGDSLKYNWYKDNSPVSDDGIITGSTTPVLGISPANPAYSGSYYALVTGACGTIAGDPQIISISNPVVITGQPSSATVCEGQLITLEIQATGSNLNYQWQKDGTPITDVVHFSGINSNLLMINQTVAGDEGSYTCIVSNGCNTRYSTASYITVIPALTIIQQPSDVTECETDEATFMVTTNSSLATYQWQKNGTNLSDTPSLTGSGSGILHIYNLQPGDSGIYQCIIYGLCDTLVSNPARLDVNSMPVIVSEPVSATLCQGQSHSFEITVTGTALHYQWMKDGMALSDGGSFAGTTTDLLQINNASIGESRQYYCTVTGTCGTLVSIPDTLTVNEVTAITLQASSSNLCADETLTLVIQASGTGNNYQWEKNNVSMVDSGTVSGAYLSVLQISHITSASAGAYRCLVTGVCNSIATQTAIITVTNSPSITLQPVGDTLCEGGNMHLKVGSTGENLNHQWKKNGIAVSDTGNISGAQTADLYIQNITPASSGAYTCEISNDCGYVNTNYAVIEVSQQGNILSQPVSLFRCAGDVASFAVTTSGSNLNYQWEYNGTPLADAGRFTGSNSPVLTISGVTLPDSGEYRCMITDDCGLTTNSDPANLTVYEPLSIISVPVGDTLCSGQSITLTVAATGSNLDYQWYKDGILITNTTGITGATTPSLILDNLTAALSGYYSCRVTASCRYEVTHAILVMVNQPAVITGQPNNLTRCEGESAVFSITATGDSLTYQWLKDGNPLVNGTGLNGAQSPVLYLSGVDAADNGSYQCTVNSACGLLTSQPAVLTVNVYPGAAGAITGDAVVCQGTTGAIYIIPDIPGAGSYNWSLPAGMVVTSGAGTRQITVSFVANEEGGPVSVAGLNVCGLGKSSPILDVVANPLPTTYAGESFGLCTDQATLTAYPPEASATGLWQVISGPATISQPDQSTTAVTNLRKGANNFQWTVTLNGCTVSDTITVYNNQVLVDAGEDTAICDYIHHLNATAPLTGTGQWSILSGAGFNINRYDPKTIVSGLAQGRNIFKWSVDNNGCISTDTVVITNNMPSESEAGTDQYIKADYTNLNAHVPSIGTGAWSLVNGSAAISNPLAYNTLVTGIQKGMNIFEWTITYQNCISRDTVIIENTLADSTDAGPNKVICGSSVKLSAKNPYPGYGEWSVKRGSANFADNSQYNTVAYNLSQGENVLIWTAYLNGITSDSVVIVNDMPTTANAGVNLASCADSINLNANMPYIGTGSWSVVSGAGVFDNLTSNRTLVRSMARGNNNYKWTITNGTCASSSIVNIVNNTPSDAQAGYDVVTCEDSIVLNPGIPTFGYGEWSVHTGSAKFKGNLAYNLGRDNNQLIYTVKNSGCYSRDTLVVASHKPSAARAGADQAICQDSVLMTANIPVTGTGTWTIQSGAASIVNASNPGTRIRNISQGENILRWMISYMGCTSYDDITITNNYVAADAGTDKILCSDMTTLEGNDPGTSQGYWSIVGGSTGATVESPYAPNSVVRNMGLGDNIFRWTISKSGCVGYDEVTITNNMPTTAFAGEDASVCADNVKLRANTILQGQGTWSVLSGSGDFADAGNPGTTVTNLASGSNVLRWTSEKSGCVSTNEVTISNNQPTDVFSGLDQELCDDSTMLYANPPNIGTGTWSVLQGSASFADPHRYNTSVTYLDHGSNILKWTVASQTCIVSDTVIINNNLPTTAIAGSDFPVCNSEGNLSANTPMFGTGEWSIISGSGTIGNLNTPMTTIRDLALGRNELRWTITNKNCISSDDLVIINNSPSIANAGEDVEVCGETDILYANSPSVGNGYWRIISGKGIFNDSLNFNTTVNGLNFGQNTLRWTTQNGNCTTSDDVVITNNLAYVYAGEDQVVYSDQAVLSGNNPSSGTGKWNLLAGAGNIGSSGNFVTPVTSLGAGLNTFEWSITNGSCTARDQVVINFKVMPVAGFGISQADGCPGMTVSFYNTTRYGTTYLWDMGDGSASTDVNPVHTYHYDGKYRVILTAYGPDNRVVTKDTSIVIHPNPVARFYYWPDTALMNEPLRCYSEESHNATFYSWDFGDNAHSIESNPVHEYDSSGTYTITLVVTSDFGCADTIAHDVVVAEEGSLIFPNAFTPNPDGPNSGTYNMTDRTNDVFHPYFENIAEFHMEIYSRWGVLLFETDDINVGWDGYYKGKLMAKDVYVWKASGRYTSGTRFVKTGNLLLIIK